MKLEDFEKVKRLIEIKGRLIKALSRLDWPNMEQEDSGGVDGFRTGYSMVLSRHPDGSGGQVDLSGCYVGNEVLGATRNILEEKLFKVAETLQALGVELES
jgi:hypothetical protein